ncbi:hypothetical protein Syun_016888 [Stephania yunnanensis]|uniref:Uncharacterized protein n=1 Tax=Stephania yunnanensis TaxID=152371 RepID=A0AAP0J5S5_9MAGN
MARLNRSQSRPNGPRHGIQSRHGGRMPGKVLAGRSVVDESILTEEFILVFKDNGLTVSPETRIACCFYAETSAFVNQIRYVLEETLEASGAFAEYESKSYEKLVSSIEDHPLKIIQAGWCK